MGDRGNIVIEKDGDMFPHPVWLYTHWGGSGLKRDLQVALTKAKPRWEDGSYAARVIFQEMIGGDDSNSGFGISTAQGDGEHPLLCVNFGDQKVRERAADRDINSPVVREWTFEEFVALKPDALEPGDPVEDGGAA